MGEEEGAESRAEWTYCRETYDGTEKSESIMVCSMNKGGNVGTEREGN